MRTTISTIILDIDNGSIQGAIEDAKLLMRLTGAMEVQFNWNGIIVKVHPSDSPQGIIEGYYKAQKEKAS